jgi:hypothetical protein
MREFQTYACPKCEHWGCEIRRAHPQMWRDALAALVGAEPAHVRGELIHADRWRVLRDQADIIVNEATSLSRARGDS